jgi:uncharacterized protein YuzE
MRLSYDSETDALMVVVREEMAIARTVEVRHGLLDLDAEGEVVAFELLGASAIIERAADLLHRPDLAEALADAVRQYVREAQDEIERSQEATRDVRA